MPAQRDNSQQARMANRPSFPNNINVETLAGTKTLDQYSAYYQVLDPDGADRDVLLPPEEKWVATKINNNAGANNLVVKDDSGVTTVATLTPGDTKEFLCDETLSWVAI